MLKGTVRRKPDGPRIGAALYEENGAITAIFSNSVEGRDPNEAEILATHEVLRIVLMKVS